ncbi:acyltransferase [Psychromonas sp. psych-6C06]|uniref:carbon-nitrogen hydrolase n=1 Tax=Psychromonas sp. psych-6C06 TaxID=2058089 RepID=UPI000C32FF38|nr:carbon-nitrogen hydrolase [Psychromonas sp. psych-6C06]PKF61550.1 acyltransferase [Psychromonas sp. psych-6C06]
MTRITAALIQQSNTADKQKNLENSIKEIKKAAKNGANLVVLQELHSSLYFCQIESVAHFDLAESIPGTTTVSLASVASSLNIVIVASIFEKRAPGIYHNTAVVLDTDGAIAGQYRKMHIPDDPGFYEKFYFTPGDGGFKPIQTSLGKLGVLVCWDQWFPEAARLMAMSGAQLLIYPTAIGWDPQDTNDEQQRQQNAWEIVQRGHAVANGLPVLACNRVGFEADSSQASAGIQFWGNSFICGPQGEILAQAPEDQSAVIMADIDLARTENIRRIWPFFRDRRIDHYHDLARLYCD